MIEKQETNNDDVLILTFYVMNIKTAPKWKLIVVEIHSDSIHVAKLIVVEIHSDSIHVAAVVIVTVPILKLNFLSNP